MFDIEQQIGAVLQLLLGGGQQPQPTGMMQVPPGPGGCPPWMPQCRGQGGGGAGFSQGGMLQAPQTWGPLNAPLPTQPAAPSAPSYNGTWVGPGPKPPGW